MNIALISSADEKTTHQYKKIVEELILTLNNSFSNLKILTGGSLGIPGIAVKHANKLGIMTKCYSPDKDEYSHGKRVDNLCISNFSEIDYIPGFTNRSLQMIHDANIVLLLNGRIGTLSEFTITLEEGKNVAVLTETGGIADHLEYILDIAQKEFPGQVFFSDTIAEIIDFIKLKTV